MNTTEVNNLISLMSNAAFEISAGILIDIHSVEYEISTTCNNKDITKHCINVLNSLIRTKEDLSFEKSINNV